jgi:hypothetical protein
MCISKNDCASDGYAKRGVTGLSPHPTSTLEPWSGAAQPAGGQEGFSRTMNKLYFNYSGEYTQLLAALTELLVAENTVSAGS